MQSSFRSSVSGGMISGKTLTPAFWHSMAASMMALHYQRKCFGVNDPRWIASAHRLRNIFPASSNNRRPSSPELLPGIIRKVLPWLFAEVRAEVRFVFRDQFLPAARGNGGVFP